MFLVSQIKIFFLNCKFLALWLLWREIDMSKGYIVICVLNKASSFSKTRMRSTFLITGTKKNED